MEKISAPRMVTIREAAKILNLPVYFIRRKIAEGTIVAVRTGNKFLVNLDRLIDYLNSNTITPDTKLDS